MTVKYSLDFNQKIQPCTNKVCKACGLYLNQLPVFDVANKSHIFWVGLSAVQFDESIERLPLSPNTKSGALINEIEKPLRENISFYKTNIVKCLPLKDGKIRYPLEHEMEKCFPNFEHEINELSPSIVFLLGKQVATFVLKKMGIDDFILSDDFKYDVFEFGETLFIPVHHPSFILVYKRKFLNKYTSALQLICEKSLYLEV
ncbi:MAG: uracil-DNA glycosylase family protein [Chitinophagaceae bacterium]|nr:uracil-DNA glycosylase family protein [Chitinophagaceae bacterium]